MTKLSTIIIALLSLCSIASGHQYALSYDNVPITAKTWEEVDISWKNPLNHKIPNTARLLRPIAYAHQRGLLVGGHVHMKLGEFGVPNANITVTNVKPLSLQTVNKIHHLPKQEKPIIGVYIHQTNDVRTYYFKDKQGHISIIHATPIHPFYVTNLHIYLPISQVNNTMQLAGNNNEIIHLVCPKDKQQRCGTLYHQGKITSVYNIEVYQKHFYRVGYDNIKVHNATGASCGLISPKKPVDIETPRQIKDFITQNNYGEQVSKINGSGIYVRAYLKSDASTSHSTMFAITEDIRASDNARFYNISRTELAADSKNGVAVSDILHSSESRLASLSDSKIFNLEQENHIANKYGGLYRVNTSFVDYLITSRRIAPVFNGGRYDALCWNCHTYIFSILKQLEIDGKFIH